MSGYQVQTPGTFSASSIASPFNPIDNLQNEQIYNLQSFQKNIVGCQYESPSDYNPGTPGGGYIILPESASDPTTPYELTLDLMLNSELLL